MVEVREHALHGDEMDMRGVGDETSKDRRRVSEVRTGERGKPQQRANHGHVCGLPRLHVGALLGPLGRALVSRELVLGGKRCVETACHGDIWRMLGEDVAHVKRLRQRELPRPPVAVHAHAEHPLKLTLVFDGEALRQRRHEPRAQCRRGRTDDDVVDPDSEPEDAVWALVQEEAGVDRRLPKTP